MLIIIFKKPEITGTVSNMTQILPAASIFEEIAFSPASLHISEANCVIYEIPITFSVILKYFVSMPVFDMISRSSSITLNTLSVASDIIIMPVANPVIRPYSGRFDYLVILKSEPIIPMAIIV